MPFDYNRYIPSIGHGQFYVEKIFPYSYINNREEDNVYVIHDCGSYDNIENLKKEINNYVFTGNDIILTISHFHKDHINGIPHLITRLNDLKKKIKAVIIPKIDKYERVLLSCEADNGNDEDDNKNNIKNFIFNPAKYFKLHEQNPIIISITNKENNKPNEQKPISISTLRRNTSRHHHKEFSILRKDICSWYLKTYVDMACFNKLSEADKSLLNRFKTKDLNKKEKIDEIRNIYKKISNNNLNKTSMITASYCRCEASNHERYLLHCYLWWYSKNQTPGTLYTGDFEIANIDIARSIFLHFKESYKNIFTLSLPHHGSTNYLMTLPLPFILYSINQSGELYKYPRAELIRRMQSWGMKTENQTWE